MAERSSGTSKRSSSKSSNGSSSSGSGSRSSSGGGRSSSGSSRSSSGSSRSSSGSSRSSSSSSRSSSSGNRSSSGGNRSSGSTSRKSNNKVTGRDAIERAREEAADLLRRPIESVLGLEPEDGGGWRVIVEVVELERIPRSTDVLGAYAITLDKSGELAAARRERRYYRNQADEE
jgi:gas vesicle protein GvpO